MGASVGVFFDGVRETFTGAMAKLQSQLSASLKSSEYHAGQAKRLRREREAARQERDEQAKAAKLQLEAEQSRRQKAERRAAQLELDLAEARSPDTPSPVFNGKGWKQKN